MNDFDLARLQSRACKGCGRPLFFARDENGKLQPLDSVAPTWAIMATEQGEPVAVRTKRSFVTHFATCPNAAAFSRGSG